MQKTIIQTKKLSKAYSNSGVQQHILKNLDLEIYEKDFTVIMGPSGSGKSTLLYALSGMDKPTLGEIYWDKQDITKLSNDQLAVFRRKNCGFLFQQIYLMDNMSIMDNVLSSGLLLKSNKKELVYRAKNLFEQVGISQTNWNKFSNQISGGEAQRAGLVRALINEPTVVFADEPTGALNSSAGKNVLDLLSATNQNNQSIVMVTHDINSAIRGNRILYLKDGLIQGTLLLGEFDENDNVRKDKLREFLAEMGW